MKRQKLNSTRKSFSHLKAFYAFFIALLLLSACNGGGPSAEDLKTIESFGGQSKEKSVADQSPPPPPSEGFVSNGSALSLSSTMTNAGATSNFEAYDKSTDEGKREDKAEPSTASSSNQEVSIKIPEKIKKTADLNLTVDDYKAARVAIEKVVKSGHAYVSGENEQNTTYSISNTMVIRVLNKEFDAMVNSITGIKCHVNSKNIYTEDVTAQFVDITARLKSKKEVEKRYIDLLQKASQVGEILEVEQNLRVIREEIEAKEGELKYLNDQVNYSTINLSVHQDFEYQPQDEPGFFGRLGHAFGNGWKGFLSFLVGVAYAWPVWVILGLVAYFLTKFIKKQLKKK